MERLGHLPAEKRGASFCGPSVLLALVPIRSPDTLLLSFHFSLLLYKATVQRRQDSAYMLLWFGTWRWCRGEKESIGRYDPARAALAPNFDSPAPLTNADCGLLSYSCCLRSSRMSLRPLASRFQTWRHERTGFCSSTAFSLAQLATTTGRCQSCCRVRSRDPTIECDSMVNEETI
jgi:hypothetical protein